MCEFIQKQVPLRKLRTIWYRSQTSFLYFNESHDKAALVRDEGC